jgi:hypothetical protein
MSSLTESYYFHRGMTLLQQEEWDAAIQSFSFASEGRGAPRPEVAVGWAKAILRSSRQWDEKIESFFALTAGGYSHPQLWAMAIQAYLHVLDQYDGRDADLPARSLLLVEQLRGVAADCVAAGTETFRRLHEVDDPAAYAWGAALVSVGDWLYEFQGADAGVTERFPYRPIAEALYRPVALSELSKLFADPEIRREIEDSLTNRARRQLHRMQPQVRPTRSARMRLDPSGWSLFALRSMG